MKLPLALPATTDINIALTEESALLEQVVIQTNRIEKSEESPLSKQTIGATEIYRNPGAIVIFPKLYKSFPEWQPRFLLEMTSLLEVVHPMKIGFILTG